MVDIEKCFPAGFTDEKVDKVKVDWRKVVFDDVACGDCLMMMLVAGRDCTYKMRHPGNGSRGASFVNSAKSGR